MNAITHILVPTDFSEASDRATTMAVELARTFAAQITLVHAWSIPNTAYAERLIWPIDGLESAARNALEEARVSLVKRHAATDAVLRVGPEWREILEVIKERGIDLVVMGTHGRRGLPRFFLGSVAERVVRLSPVPVLTTGPLPAPEKNAEPL